MGGDGVKMRLMCRSGAKTPLYKMGGGWKIIMLIASQRIPSPPPPKSNLDNMFSATSVSGATCSPRCLTILPPDLLSGDQAASW